MGINMDPIQKVKAKVKFKESEKDELELRKEIDRMNEEMGEYRKENEVVESDPNAYTPFTPDEQEVEVVEKQVLHLTADELAKIIAAAQGKYVPNERPPLPPDATMGDKVKDFADDALGEVGRGAHRIADGCRDIVGGAIDIITLGRAHRR